LAYLKVVVLMVREITFGHDFDVALGLAAHTTPMSVVGYEPWVEDFVGVVGGVARRGWGEEVVNRPEAWPGV